MASLFEQVLSGDCDPEFAAQLHCTEALHLQAAGAWQQALGLLVRAARLCPWSSEVGTPQCLLPQPCILVNLWSTCQRRDWLQEHTLTRSQAECLSVGIIQEIFEINRLVILYR